MPRRVGLGPTARRGLGILVAAGISAACARPTAPPPVAAVPPPPPVSPAPTAPPSIPTALIAQLPPTPVLRGEDGAIPILEYHAMAAEEGRWARTPAGLQSDLQQLYDEGFRPINMAQLGQSPLPVPEGRHPVVLTFDDGLPSQFAWSAAGAGSVPDPKSAAGVLWQFHEAHPDWAFAATFFVNAHPFGEDSAGKLAWLVAHGAEIGNHTYDHVDMTSLDPAARAAEIGRLQVYLAGVLPGYTVQSFAFPYGSLADAATVAHGQYAGARWDFHYLALVGSGPLQAQPGAEAVELPRIQVAAPETCPPSTRRFIWSGWQQAWLPTAHLYTVRRV